MHTIEKVTWLDSFSGSGWKVLDKAKSGVAMECISIGYVVDETDKYIMIAPHYHEDNEDVGAVESVCGDMAIPKCSILERQLLVTAAVKKAKKRK